MGTQSELVLDKYWAEFQYKEILNQYPKVISISKPLQKILYPLSLNLEVMKKVEADSLLMIKDLF